MRSFVFFFILLIGTVISQYDLSAKARLLRGIVKTKDTEKPIPGATVRIVGADRGTYTSSRGSFRLPLKEGDKKIKVFSIGHKSKVLFLKDIPDSLLTVALNTLPARLEGVEAVGKISAGQVVQRAIDRKEENMAKLKTFSGLLYSKIVLELGGSVFADAESDGNSITISGTLGAEAPESARMFVAETFSRTFRDYEKKISGSHIIQRRQTANIKPEQNILAIGNFMNFYDESIQLINARMITPLSADAPDYYDFTIEKRAPLDDRFVYVVRVRPSTDVYPLFYGTISIVEGTYDLVEVDLRPSRDDAIPFLDSLRFHQKFEEIEKELWLPMYLEASGKANVEIIRGLIDLNMDVLATSIYSEAEVNKPLPDSIYRKKVPRIVSVAPDADSVKMEFWEENALRDISPREIEMYARMDSVVAVRDSLKEAASDFHWKLFPYVIAGYVPLPALEFNRAGAITLYAEPYAAYRNISLRTKAAYSFGLKEALGAARLYYLPVNTNSFFLSLNAGVFSDMAALPGYINYSAAINTVFAALFHIDYSDYFKKDGWSAGFNTSIYGSDLYGSLEYSRQFSLNKTTNNSIFSSSRWRDNPAVSEGGFKVATAGIRLESRDFFPGVSFVKAEAEVKGLYGEYGSAPAFRSVEYHLKAAAPTFPTGYTPMELEIRFDGGSGGGLPIEGLPLQYLFSAPTALGCIGEFGAFYSAPMGVYGGTRFYAAHLNYKLTDLLWRAVGLPLYEGRGLDMTLCGSAGVFEGGDGAVFKQTHDKPYLEAGFGLSRIPTFISNVIFLSFDARWGLGTTAKGRFGWAASISTPF